MASLPTRIKVGYRDYAVEDWPANVASSSERHGECDRLLGIIRVRADLPLQYKAEVLWHEVLHAAYDMGAISTGDEEKTVTILTNQTMQIWRDNPDLIAFIDGALKP